MLQIWAVVHTGARVADQRSKDDSVSRWGGGGNATGMAAWGEQVPKSWERGADLPRGSWPLLD
jgi:hypothetical protein